MGKHRKGEVGTSMSGWSGGSGGNWKKWAKNRRFLERQQRLSGKVMVVFDRDQNIGALPKNLKDKEH
jgi:hypothetical protein